MERSLADFRANCGSHLEDSRHMLACLCELILGYEALAATALTAAVCNPLFTHQPWSWVWPVNLLTRQEMIHIFF